MTARPVLDVEVSDWAGGMLSREVKPHPAEQRVGLANSVWARKHGLVADDVAAARHAAIRCASCAAHTYARAPDYVVELGADLITWLFLFDDCFGEGAPGDDVASMRRRFDGYENLLRSGELPGESSVFHGALRELRERFLERGNDAWLARFTSSLHRYFEGCLLEFPYRRARTCPDVEEYRRLRAWSIGCLPVFDLIELGSGILSDEEAALPNLSRARETAALLCAWVNDVYSFPKEHADDEPMNLVSVLASQYDLSPGEALRTATHVFNTDWAVLDDLSETLREECPSLTLRAYLSGIEDWVHGNRAWTSLCGRYTPAVRAPSAEGAGGG
jgi:hypothetical protein